MAKEKTPEEVTPPVTGLQEANPDVIPGYPPNEDISPIEESAPSLPSPLETFTVGAETDAKFAKAEEPGDAGRVRVLMTKTNHERRILATRFQVPYSADFHTAECMAHRIVEVARLQGRLPLLDSQL